MAGVLKLAEKKVCPFCLEDVPIKAVKCRHCESAIEDVTFSTIETIHTSSTPGKQKEKSAYGQPDLSKLDGNWSDRNMMIYILPAILVLLVGLGAWYWFFYHETTVDLEEVAEIIVDGDLRGAWRSSGDQLVYFQFLPNQMVNVAVPTEGYWFRTQYRLSQEEEITLLELYHRNKAEWETVAEIEFIADDMLILLDRWDVIYMQLERVPDSIFRDEFREVISDLHFQG